MPASELAAFSSRGEEEGVSGGAEGEVRCAVGVLEVKLMRGGDGAVIAGRSGGVQVKRPVWPFSSAAELVVL